VFEDIHWAEATLVELIDAFGERARGPILCLCSARPEQLETGPGDEQTTVALAPLMDEEAEALVESLETDLAPDLRARIVETSEGNPLFAEQLVAHANEEGRDASTPFHHRSRRCSPAGWTHSSRKSGRPWSGRRLSGMFSHATRSVTFRPRAALTWTHNCWRLTGRD
jgi:hypothetical protein